MLIKLAFRNIFRRKIRTILSLSVLGLGIYLAVFYDGMLNGFTNDMINIYIDTDIGYYVKMMFLIKGLLIIVLGILSGIGIINTMMMAVFERKKEIGVMLLE